MISPTFFRELGSIISLQNMPTHFMPFIQKVNKYHVIIFWWWPGSNSGPYIYYALFIPIELSYEDNIM